MERRSMAEGEWSFRGRMVGIDPHSERGEGVLDYVVQRAGDRARLEDVPEEQYVRRHASAAEYMLRDPRLVRVARKKTEDLERSGHTTTAIQR